MTQISKYSLIELDTIDSTNSEARRIVLSGEATMSIIWAHHQTEARGRYGRKWQTGSDNLCMSILMQPLCAITNAHELSFVIGLAVHDVVTSLINSEQIRSQIRLKWPNDIFIHDNKIGGILLESVSYKEKVWVVIGLGLNLSHAPSCIQNASCLKDYGVNIVASDILRPIIENFEKYIDIWREDGFATICKVWLERAYRIGQNVVIEDADRIISGVFESIDESGAMILRLKSGDVYIHRS